MRQISMWHRVVLGVVLAVSFSYAYGADVTARIKGVVTDPTGAVIPKATITATNVATGIVATTYASETGDYTFQALPIGTYSLSVSAPGFKSFSATGIVLNIDQVYVEPVKLTVGSSMDTVSVEANAVQVDSSNMQLSNVVDAAQIVELPLIGRAFTQLEQISPGIQASSDRFGGFSANGAQTQQSSFLINGTDTNDLPLNTITFQPSIDALAQYNLVTSSLNPEYSRNSGGIVSATIKNGTNHFHGNIFEFYRDTFLNNRSYFQKTAPVYHQNLFGGTLGGPILKDKLFFFGSYQGNRARQPQAQNNNTVYTSNQLGGDFSTVAITAAAAGHKIPSTITIPNCPTGTTFGTCFGYNAATGRYTKAIPTAAYNSISAALIQKYVPPPNSGTNIFTYTGTTTIIQDQGIGRLDYNPTQKDSIWALVIQQHAPSLNTIPFSGATVPGFGDGSGSEIKQYAVSYTRQLTSTALNELSVHYNRFNFNSGQPQQVSLPSSYGFNITPSDLASAGLPTIAVGSNFTLGSSSNGPQPRIDQTYQADDNFSKVIGRHSLKFGYDGRRFQVLNNFDAKNSGSFAFSNTNNQGTGSALIDFALGIPNTYTQSTQGQINAYAFENYMYGQDTWRATNELTLTLGAGYQIDTALHNRQYNGIGVTCYTNGQVSKVFPTAPKGLNFPGDPGCNDASGAKTGFKNIGPRVGFAYSPSNLGFISGGGGKFSIRGGFGLYYNRSEEETSLNNLNDPPYGLTSGGATDYASLGASKPSFANPFRDLPTGTVYANKFPAPVPQPGQAVNFAPYEPIDVSQYSPQFRIPYAMNFNLTIERELPSQIVARISYVGALGRHNQMYNEGNPITAAGRAACLADVNCADPGNQFADDFQTLDYPSHYLFGNSDVFPSIGYVESEGTSNYNSLQLSATKGLTHGLLFQISYTLSHSLDDSSNYENAGYGGSTRGYNQYNPTLNYGNSAFDARNRLVIAPVYVVPYHEGGSKLVNLLAAGWEISGIQTFAQGFPYDISYGGGVSYSLYCSAGTAFYACPDIPQQIAPLKRIDPRSRTALIQSQWFSGTSFVDETVGTFGNIGRNTYHGPGRINTDAQLSKNFRYGADSAKTIQLRIEGYNVFNHTNFSLPDGNIGDSTFGHITGSLAGRQIQLAGKFYF
jgi:hypothetical protein